MVIRRTHAVRTIILGLALITGSFAQPMDRHMQRATHPSLPRFTMARI